MSVKLNLFAAGHCQNIEAIALRGGALRCCQFPALCGVIHHPRYGIILYDTGYTSHFFTATQRYPHKLYAKLTPVSLAPEQSLKAQLAAKGIAADEVRLILISHFHADHIAGLRDFPKAKLLCSAKAYQKISGLSGLRGLLHGFLPTLLPEDFRARLQFAEQLSPLLLPAEYQPFKLGFDLFGDQSIILVELPGHAHGQLGALVREQTGRESFLVADACWYSHSYRQNVLPGRLSFLVHANFNHYKQTLAGLHSLAQHNPGLRIIPSHCQEIWQSLVEFNHE